MIKDFKEQAKICQLSSFKDKLKELKRSYDELQEKFNDICDKLDVESLDGGRLNEMINYLTVYVSEMDIIQRKIKEISIIIDNINTELSN